MKSYIKTIFLMAITTQAFAQDKSNSGPDLKVLYSADSTRIAPRISGLIGAKPTATPTTWTSNNGSSIPLKTAYTCQAYRGQYDIDNNAIGTFYIFTESNPFLPNYGQVIQTDNSGCYQPCTPTNQTTYQSCASAKGSGWTGNITYNTYSSCSAGGYLQAQSPTYVSDNCQPPPPPVTTPPIVISDPIPTPTPTPTPPPVSNPVPSPLPTGCESNFGIEPIGKIMTRCDIWSNAASYPRGEQFTCKAAGWSQTKTGSSTVLQWCN